MLRILLATTFLAAPAWADDFLIAAPVTDVIVYPNGATVGRTFSVELPEGQHRVLIPYSSDGTPPRVSVPEGLALGAVQVLPGYLTDADSVLSDSQKAAQARVDTARTALNALQDSLTSQQSVIVGQDQRIAYLRSISGTNLENMNAQALSDTGDMVATQIAQATLKKVETEARLRDAVEARDEAQKALAQAERDLARQSPPQGDVDVLAISVDANAAGGVEMSLDTLIRTAGWQADYELNLTRGDPAKIDISRKVVLGQWTEEAWTDVALTLSTADPFAQILPTEPFPSLAQILTKGKQGYGSSFESESLGADSDGRASAAPEPSMVVSAQTVIEGLSVTYAYPQPVGVAPGEQVILSLDDFTFDAREFSRAAPRFDQTAFLMAEFTNTTKEPFLPGEASISRDGVFVGRVLFEQIPAGAKAELSFGALEGLRLEYTLLDNNTGDRGFLTSSSTRNQEIEFSVENLLDTTETVQTIFALPIAEQEDLIVKVRTVPQPDEENYDQRRGVSVWSLELEPGEKKTVRVTINLDWPEGGELFWQP